MKQFVLDLIIMVFILVHYFEMNLKLKLGKYKSNFNCHFLLFFILISWHNVTSILSNKQRQITITIKNGNDNIQTLIYYTDSSNYNRYCLRLLHLFLNHFSKYSPNELE
jgi:hypothetical protein